MVLCVRRFLAQAFLTQQTNHLAEVIQKYQHHQHDHSHQDSISLRVYDIHVTVMQLIGYFYNILFIMDVSVVM